MFNRQRPIEDPKLRAAIDDALDSLTTRNPDDEEYARVVNQIVKLYSVQQKPDKISREALLNGLVNLTGILIIVGHERAHTMASRAIGFVQKLR